MDSNKDEEKIKEFYWPVYPKDIPEVKYEVRTVYLQNEVSMVRKFLCQSYSNLKTYWNALTNSYSNSYRNLKGQLKNNGITKDSLVVQGVAVGGAISLGYLIARKKSIWRRLLYPSLGGALVGGAFYLSYDKNRQWVKEHLKNQLKAISSRKN